MESKGTTYSFQLGIVYDDGTEGMDTWTAYSLTSFVTPK